MAMLLFNYCPFCGNDLKVMNEICPFCNRDLSYLCTEDVLESRAASVILDCLDAMPAEFGRYVLASVLKGTTAQVIMDNGLDANPYYGDLGKLSKKEIINMIDSLIEGGFIDTVVKEEEISHIRLAERGQLALDGKDIAWVRLPYKLAEHLEPLFTPTQKAVIPELRSMRRNLADANNIRPYMIFNDDTLKDIALKLPTTVEELEMVKGIKEVKAKKYSKEILETVNWVLENFNKKHDMMILEIEADSTGSGEPGQGEDYSEDDEESDGEWEDVEYDETDEESLEMIDEADEDQDEGEPVEDDEEGDDDRDDGEEAGEDVEYVEGLEMIDEGGEEEDEGEPVEDDEEGNDDAEEDVEYEGEEGDDEEEGNEESPGDDAKEKDEREEEDEGEREDAPDADEPVFELEIDDDPEE